MRTSLSHPVLLIDLDLCVRCHACEVACREEHNLAVETRARWMNVMTVGPRECEGKLHMDFVPTLCFHCEPPFCGEACPKGAIHKTEEGLVAIDEKSCSGCRLCVSACPYGQMSFNEITGLPGHCDQCRSRVEAGLMPACVQHCIAGALQWIDLENLETAASGAHKALFWRVCYVSGKWPTAGGCDRDG